LKKLCVIFLLVFTFNPNAVNAVQNEKFKNCAALNAKYPGGIAKSDKAINKNTKGEIVKSKKPFEVSSKIYTAHKSLDRDKDNIVCEK